MKLVSLTIACLAATSHGFELTLEMNLTLPGPSIEETAPEQASPEQAQFMWEPDSSGGFDPWDTGLDWLVDKQQQDYLAEQQRLAREAEKKRQAEEAERQRKARVAKEQQRLAEEAERKRKAKEAEERERFAGSFDPTMPRRKGGSLITDYH